MHTILLLNRVGLGAKGYQGGFGVLLEFEDLVFDLGPYYLLVTPVRYTVIS
jgi:hypothetical protein